MAVLAAVAALALPIPVAPDSPAEASWPVPVFQPAAEVQGCDVRCWHGRYVRQGHKLRASRTRTLALRRMLRVRWAPTVTYALRLASATYGVSYGALSSVAYCESTHSPFARNGTYRGLFQEGPMFENGPFGRAGFSVYDPVANSMTAASVVARQGWRQWSCRP